MSCFKRAKRVRDVVVSTVEPKDNNVIWLKPVDDGYTFYINDGIDWNAVNVGGISMSAVESMLAKKAELSDFEAEVNERVLLALKVEGKADKTALDNKASKEDLSNVVTNVSDSLAVFSEQSLGLLDLKVDKVDGKGLSTNDFTNEYKTKIDSLDKQEVSINVDDTLSPTSVNPVQNKVINTALAGKANASHTHTKNQITDFPEEANKEAYLEWGGKDLSGTLSPVDVAMSSFHSANRAQFCNPAGVTIEYSTDGGSTWIDYGFTDNNKIALMCDTGTTLFIGKKIMSITTNDKLRITLNATSMGFYTRLRKMLINISTNGAGGSYVTVEYSTKASETTWTTLKTNVDISGWSAWNSLYFPAPAFGGNANQSSNWANIRLTFGITAVSSNTSYSSALSVSNILVFGDTCWSYPSKMAQTGHLYSYDTNQNAYFPAAVFEGGTALSDKYAAKVKLQVVASTDTSVTLAANTITLIPDSAALASLSVTLPSGATSDGQEYILQYSKSALSDSATLTFPSTLKWVNGKAVIAPSSMEEDSVIQISVVNGCAVWCQYYIAS